MATTYPSDGEARKRAEESVATRFSRMMKASTSPLGVLTDPPIVALATAPLVLAFLGVLQADVGPAAVRAIGVLATAPLTLAVVVTLALSGARGRVVGWLARTPFPVENMNAVLNG